MEVAGAEPGDTLQVDLLEFEFEPADWGWTASIPGFGLLAVDFPDGHLKITRLDPSAGDVEFWPGVRISLAPFCGELGVAPETGRVPRFHRISHGGNMAPWTASVSGMLRGPPRAGVAQLAERQPSKLHVAGSIPVSRSTPPRGGRSRRLPQPPKQATSSVHATSSG